MVGRRLPNFLLVLLALTFSVSLFAKPTNLVPALVTEVIDGDTIRALLDGQEYKVRLIGVNTPETNHPSLGVQYYGPEAKDFTETMLTGKKVYLEFDVDRFDQYDRLLAYVWLEEPEEITDEEIRQKLFNAILLLEGYAQVMTVPPNVKYADYFVQYQIEAKENQKGLWAPKQVKQQPQQTSKKIIVYITKTGKKYHRAGCRYLSKSSIPITLEEAKNRGYTPCSVCDPPR